MTCALHTYISIIIGDPSQCTKARKDNKRYIFWKEVKLFVDDTDIYVENAKSPIKYLLVIIEFSKR